MKANKGIEEAPVKNLGAVKSFFGKVESIVRFNFSEKFQRPCVDEDEAGKFVGVGVSYALHQIRGRINQMNNVLEINKGGSWPLSEGFLATMLLLMQYDETETKSHHSQLDN